MYKIKYYNNSYDFYNPSSPCISVYQSIDFIKSKILVSHMLLLVAWKDHTEAAGWVN